MLLWLARPFGPQSRELFLLTWILAYFLAFSLAHGKAERYLLPIVPPLGLAIGYLYHKVFTSSVEEFRHVLLSIGLLCVVSVIGLILGPYILEGKYGVSTAFLPPLYILLMTGLSGWLLWQVISSRIQRALQGLGVLAFGWMIGVIGFFLPAMDATASPRAMFYELRALLSQPDAPLLAFQRLDWRGDEDFYYWRYRHPYWRYQYPSGRMNSMVRRY